MRPPTIAPTVVGRARLLEARWWSSPVILVAAPAGSGKTTLAAQYAARERSRGRATAWLTLASDDRTFPGVWTGIIATCSLAYEEAGAEQLAAAIRDLRSAGTEESSVVTALANLVASGPRDLLMVLDDAHELPAGRAADAVIELVRASAGRLQLVLAGRWDPPVPVGRMILEELATQIRSDDLSFQLDEAAAMLGHRSITLTDPQLSRLVDRTEGWAAGLQLAAVCLARLTDTSRYESYLESFAGDARPVADYLVAEVLGATSADMRAFMAATAIPEQVGVDLALALTGRPDAGELLERLADHNLLVTRHEGPVTTYRYHCLLRTYLQAEESRRDEPARRRLEVTAARWYEDRHMVEHAIRHRCRAADWPGVTRLLEEHGLDLVLRGRGHVVEGAAAALPPPCSQAIPMVLLDGVAAVLAGDATRLEQIAVRLGRHPGEHQNPTRRVLHACVLTVGAILAGQRSAGLTEWAEIAEDPRADPAAQVLGLATRGKALAFTNDFGAAQQALERAHRLAEAAGYHLTALDCLSHLVVASAGLGDHDRLLSRARRAMDTARAYGWTRSATMAGTYGIGMWAAWMAADDDAHLAHLRMADRMTGSAQPNAVMGLGLHRAFAEFAVTRDTPELRRSTTATWDATDLCLVAPQTYVVYAITELGAALDARDWLWSEQILGRSARILPAPASRVLTAAAQLARGHGARALGQLSRGWSEEVAPLPYLVQWGELVRVAGLAERHEPASALQALATALALGSASGSRRPFLEAPAGARRFLLDNLGRYPAHQALLEPILDALRASQERPAPAQPLTLREAEVLGTLHSDLTVAEIAEMHFLSENTIRTHLKAIYRKLDVSTRRDAVRTAERYGLL